MIVQCPACLRLVDVDAFERDGDAVGVRCPQCDVVEWLGARPAGDKARSSPARAEGAAAVVPPVPATAQDVPTRDNTGLIKSVHALSGSDTEGEIMVAFSHLLDGAWTDEAAHKKLAQRAQLGESLAVLGKAYRTVREQRPDDEMARLAQDRIVTLAMSTLTPLAASQRAPAQGKTVKIVMVIVGLGIMALAGLYIARTLTTLGAE